MPQSHHQSVRSRGGDFEHRWNTGAVDDQRVIAGGGEGILDAFKDRAPVVEYLAGLAVQQIWSAYDASTEGLAHRLMAQTNAEQRNFPREMADHVERDPGVVRRAGAGRKHDALRREILDLIDR